MSAAYDADLILYSGGIDDSGLGQLIEVVLAHKQRPNVILLIRTNGGSANAAYQIARFLQKIYDQFILFAPSYCYSAGTIVALGAHKLIVTPFTEMGPLDVQLFKQNEIGARKSGLLTRAAFEGLSEASFELFEQFMLGILRKSGGLVSFRVAAEVSATITSGLMSRVYEKLDPDVIGGDRRDLEVALHYGFRLIKVSGNADVSTIFHLVNHYPAHDCIIDDEEAKSLFNHVEYPSPELMLLSAMLGETAYGDSDETVVVSLSDADSEESADDADDQNHHEGALNGSGETEARGVGDGRHPDREGDSGEANSSGESQQPDLVTTGRPRSRKNGRPRKEGDEPA